MPTGGQPTLTQFLIESRRPHPAATGDLNALVTAVALACKAMSRKVSLGTLAELLGQSLPPDPTGRRELEILGQRMFLRATEWGGQLSGMLSADMTTPYVLPRHCIRGKYLLVFRPLDGASNLDVNVTVGSLFSILRAPTPGADPALEDFLQPGLAQVCAGYAIYGPATMLVLTFGQGTHAFTLEPQLGEWVLSHPNLSISKETNDFAIDTSQSRFWEPGVKRYVDECLAGKAGARGHDHNLRWVASLVAETHRVLLRGGICLYPHDTRDPSVPGRIRLLDEASPVAFLVEQAHGRASTGRGPVLELRPEDASQRTALFFGTADEVTRIETYHREESVAPYRSPLFGDRGLFSDHE